LIAVNSLLKAVLGNEYIKGRIVDTDNDSLTDEFAASLFPLSVHNAARLNVNTLLLGILGRVFLRVAGLSGLDKSLDVFGVFNLPFGKNRLKLAVNNQISVATRWVCEMSVKREIQSIVWIKMLGSLARDVIFGSVHGFDEKGFHTLADIGVVHFEKTVLKCATAGCVHFVADLIHTIGEGLESSRVGWALASEKCFLWQTLGDLLCHIAIGLVHQLLDQFMRWSRIEDVMFNGYILIVKLVDESQWGDGFPIRAQTLFSELLADSLKFVSKYRKGDVQS
jgi:hypothetical protein